MNLEHTALRGRSQARDAHTVCGPVMASERTGRSGEAEGALVARGWGRGATFHWGGGADVLWNKTEVVHVPFKSSLKKVFLS